jgi:L-amino acid N-acyltransferase YncA
VHHEFLGRGVGSLLAREILNRAEALGYHVVVAGGLFDDDIVPSCSVLLFGHKANAGLTSGNERSVRFHEKLGFSFVGRCHRDPMHAKHRQLNAAPGSTR